MVKPIEEGSEIGPTPLADTRNAPVLAQGGGESGQATNSVEARLNLFLAPVTRNKLLLAQGANWAQYWGIVWSPETWQPTDGLLFH
jgi:hypothetical protein